MWDPSTIDINKSDLTLYLSLDGPAGRCCSLVLYSGAETGKRFALEDGAATIGRAADCTVCLDSPGISRRHAEVLVSGGGVTIRDLGSANGSQVNGQRIEGIRVLHDGDLLRLGEASLKFYETQSLDAALHDRIYRMATVDVGTGVFNRRYLTDTLKREFRLARQTGRPLCLIGYDLDHFKQVNDRHGHNAGDLVLRETAAIARDIVRDRGVLGRMGGEEFVVLLPNVDLVAATVMAQRICDAMAGHAVALPDEGGLGRRQISHHQTVSLGVARFDAAMQEPKDLLEAADRKLYESKRGGRNRVSI